MCAMQQDSSAARIRDNQRRCRARRREFVEDLKAKISEYDRRGVQATLEMRRAARAVALENSRLRSLLASRGITNEDVEIYLASFNNNNNNNNNHNPISGDSAAIIPSTPQPDETDEPPPIPDSEYFHSLNQGVNDEASCAVQVTNITHTVQQDTSGNQSTSQLGDGDNLDRHQNHLDSAHALALDKLTVLAHISAQQPCCGLITQCSVASNREVQGDSMENSLYAPSSPSPTLLPPPSPRATASHLEMSCTAAAHIMSGMQRHGNEELVREALGCTGPGECLVKNTMLFQLLDSTDAI